MIRDREGDHGGRFTLPDGRRAHGTLTLASDKPPRVSLHPDGRTPIGPGGRGFPQDSEMGSLVGHLYSNEQVIVGDVHLSEWFPDHFAASGRWAIIGLSMTDVTFIGWTTLRVRLSGLETLLGNAIASTSWPKTMDVDPMRFSADLNKEAVHESAAEGVSIKVGYDQTFSATDPFQFTLTNFATATLVAESPLGVDEWLREWIAPLLSLVTLATGERERINTVTVSAPDPDPPQRDLPMTPEIKAQLWGGGIHQQEQAAERRTRRDGAPLVPLFTLSNAMPLAKLLRRWHTSIASETAASLYRLAIDDTLPAQVRYLLNAQALESLDAGTRAAAEAAENAVHAERRRDLLEALKVLDDDHLDAAAKRFISDNLSRRPHRSMAGRLSRLMRIAPIQTRIAEWTQRTALLAEELESAGRISTQLHERLASARNALSHGVALSPQAITPANHILEALLRVQLLERLGFDEQQRFEAYERVASEP